MAEQRQGGAAERTPDALKKAGRVQTVLGMLRSIQDQRFRLEVEVVANGIDDSAPAPTAPQRTVGEQTEFLKAAEARLLDKYSDLLPDIRRELGD